MALQADRPLKVFTPLGADAMLVDGFAGQEAISTPFEYHVRMLSENDAIQASSLLRKPVHLSIQLADGSEKYIHGLVSRFVSTGRRHKYAAYEATLAPWLWFLTLSRDCRIFQKKTVPEIVEELFKDNGYSDYQFKLYKSYPQREYCVQYRETTFDFVSRLLEEEGIFYFFEHSDSKHTLILADSAPAIQPCRGASSFRVLPEASMTLDEDVIMEMTGQQRVGTGAITLRDYNFETPSSDLTATFSGSEPNEIYDYPGNYSDHGGGDRYARLRLEEREMPITTITGMSNCRPMTAGYKFDVTEHYRRDLNQTYLLTVLRQSMDTSSYQAGATGRVDYSNQFEAIPFSVPYRPPLKTPKPRIYGVQTAVVVGPAGEEIYVDKYGRVKVQFFWDRIGKKNENSSCWIRVSQHWAGKAWGSIHLPRIGQEVIVEFLEGDPDRPIITGRVYNAEQTVPYALPDHMTQSGIKSRSSKNGSTDNYNEIRFEDLKGSEMILIHAEKDLTTEVENDEIRNVGHDRTTTIKSNETKTVQQGDETITIETGKQTITVQGNQTLTIKQGNQSTTLNMGNQATKVDLGKIETEAMQSIELKVGQSSIKIDQTGVTIKGMIINIEGQVQVQVKGVMTQVNGDAMLTLKGGITMIN